NPERLIIDFPDVSIETLQHIPINANGVKRVRIGLNRANPPLTRVVVDLESSRSYKTGTSGGKTVFDVLPLSTRDSKTGESDHLTKAGSLPQTEVTVTAPPPNAAPKVVDPPLAAMSEPSQPSVAVRRSFRVKYVAENSAYIDGGSNAGLRQGMTLVIHDFDPF